MICCGVSKRAYGQVRATATVTATVLPGITFELKNSNTAIPQNEASPLTLNLKGTGNILVVVDSKDVKSINILQLNIEKASLVILPSSLQKGMTSITYLSS